MELADKLAAVFGLSGEIVKEDAAALEVNLNTPGEEFCGLGGAAINSRAFIDTFTDALLD